MSRLDRFLLSGEWCLTWPNCTQVVRMRGLSDHCPLVLAAVRMRRTGDPVPRGYVGKMFLGTICLCVKSGIHSSLTAGENLPSRIESLKDRLAARDEKGGEEVLSESELAELHGVSSDIHSLSRLNASICLWVAFIKFWRRYEPVAEGVKTQEGGRRLNCVLR
ncbi:cysteine-rich receptor-like protein kinase [Trifolium pratense]|uniref:Cysteine-rich receptor-like protein kinase n=1 Tax=Trifolium pratense TaxID=57577 RepID=A0A2K3LXN5_TRIPR|nr:cysteine-rich receptor-like protein kinase [Trifolium pratense]